MDCNENSDVQDMECDKPELDFKKKALEKKEEGNTAYSSKSYKLAVELYTAAINLDSQCASYYANRAAAYMMLQNFDKALEDAKKAFTLDSSFVKAYHRAAKCYIATGRANDAMLTLQKARSLEPKNKLILNELKNVKIMVEYESQGAAAYEKSDYRRIEFCMRRLLEYAPFCLSYKGIQAECLALTGKYNEAQLLANDVLRRDSHNVEALFVRGLCFYYQDQTERAYKLFQQILKTDPDFKKAQEAYKKAKNLEATKEAGNKAFQNQNYTEAKELYSRALDVDPINKSTNSKLYCNRATVNFKLGNHDECIQDCTNAIELDSTYLKAYLRRAKCYMDTEKYEEAVRDYEKVTKLDHGQEYRRLLKDAKLELKKSKRKDYYKILGVSKTATEAEIRKAYRKEALMHHPDRHSNETEEVKKQEEIKFKEAGEAYNILSDDEKRQRYDSGKDLEDGGMDFGDFDPNIIFQSFFGGGGGTRFSTSRSQGFPGSSFSFSFG